jgi:uncharacterized protein (DUF1684 family)
MRWMLLATLAVGTAWAAKPADYTRQIEQWRTERVERLMHPSGWLALVGLHWIEPGTHRIGRAADNDIVLATGPDHLGTLALADGKLMITPAPDAGTTISGSSTSETFELIPDSRGTPNVVSFANGAATLHAIERGGRFGLRVRDALAPTRVRFAGIENYPIDEDWRFQARFEAHPPGRTIQIANVLGQLEAMANPGAVVFEHKRKTYRLEAVDEGDGQLFLIFADRTNGKHTYGAGRFLYAAAPVDGRTEVDFNKAYNPPCAFSEYSTCPLPPPENRLDLAVKAGEKKYAGPKEAKEP